MNLNTENSGVRLKTAITEDYVSRMIRNFALNPLWTGVVDVDLVGDLDVKAHLIDFEVTEVRHEHIGLTMDLRVDCKKTSGFIKSSAQLEMRIELLILPVFEDHIWNDLKVDILNIDLLDDSKIKIGLITFSNTMIEGVVNKLQPKIERSIESMINVPQIVIGLSKNVPNQIPILNKPKIYLDANIKRINISDLLKEENIYQIKGRINSAVHICDRDLGEEVKLPFLISNHRAESDRICPVVIELSWDTVSSLINQNISKIEGLPDGVSIYQVDVSFNQERLILDIKGDMKGIEKVHIYFRLKLNKGQLEVSDVDIDNVEGSFLMKNLLKISESVIVSKSVDIVNRKLDQLMQNGKKSIYKGLTHKLQQFKLDTQAEDVELVDLSVEKEGLVLHSRIKNLSFLLADIPAPNSK